MRRGFLAFCLVSLLSVPSRGSPIDEWGNYETAVRDGALPRGEARAKLAPLVERLSSCLDANYSLHAGSWSFPLRGYGVRALYRRDFQPRSYYGSSKAKGYDFFDGNRHGGHPAYDIFIHDKNQDCRDDRTGVPVNALSMADAVVLSTFSGWKEGSMLRGGNYAWLYNEKENAFFYYAHLKDVAVKPGERVLRGGVIGTVGRTGAAAAERRSPTHLHLMVVRYNKGALIPFDYYVLLPKKPYK